MTLGDATFVIGVLTFVGTCAGFVFTWMRDVRAHRWLVEDLRASKQSADLAYNEANSMNVKLEKFNARLIELYDRIKQ